MRIYVYIWPRIILASSKQHGRINKGAQRNCNVSIEGHDICMGEKCCDEIEIEREMHFDVCGRGNILAGAGEFSMSAAYHDIKAIYALIVNAIAKGVEHTPS